MCTLDFVVCSLSSLSLFFAELNGQSERSVSPDADSKSSTNLRRCGVCQELVSSNEAHETGAASSLLIASVLHTHYVITQQFKILVTTQFTHEHNRRVLTHSKNQADKRLTTARCWLTADLVCLLLELGNGGEARVYSTASDKGANVQILD